VAWREFPDHHGYGTKDAEDLARWAATSGAAAVVCTHKDLVKLQTEQLGKIPLWALEIGIQFLEGEQELRALLESSLGATSRKQNYD